MKKILVTGFEPFGGWRANSSGLVTEALEAPEGLELAKLVLPVEYAAAEELLAGALERERPDCLLSLGQDGFRPGFSIERVAINLDCPPDAPIDENGPAAYFSTLPVRELAGALNAAGFSARVSYSAGTEACNHAMYAGCRLAGLYGVALSGLVHLPLLPEQRADAPGRRGMRAMPLPEQLKAVGIMLAVIADRLAREK